MLQPIQLAEVSARYPDEIAELRDFLQKADCVCGAEASLHAIASRLQRDRAFHRDLTSHLWIVIHLCPRNISYPDLLGIVAIAAAGQQFAAQSHEDDAHAMLRFVMEARQSLEAPVRPAMSSALHPPPQMFAAPVLAPPVPLPQPPVQAEIIREPEIFHRQSRPIPTAFRALDVEEKRGGGTRLLLIACLAVLVVAVGLGVRYRGLLHDMIWPATEAVVVTQPTPAPPSDKDAVADVRSEAAPAVSTSTTASKKSTHKAPKPAPAHSAHKAVVVRQPAPVVASSAVPSAAVPAPPKAAPPAAVRPAPVLTARNAPAGAAAVNLGSPYVSTDPAAADTTGTVRGSSAPRLLRRTPEQQAAAAPAVPSGTVHATTLGSGASLVVYSPTPAYPAAASAAHVQGEVKLQANVDSQGNVASVRVISGPPLLREAALDAAQHWRYRPNVEGGLSAITVFAFQLP